MEFQEYLSLGYLYLLVLGLLIDVMQYSYLNINILHYATFLDILITPIKHLVTTIILPIAFGITVLLVYIWIRFLVPKIARSEKAKQQATFTVEKLLLSCALATAGLFLGLGMGMGAKGKELLAKGALLPHHIIIFKDNKSLKVNIIGQNSMYIFYVPEKGKEVIITPISDNIFQIKRITTSNK